MGHKWLKLTLVKDGEKIGTITGREFTKLQQNKPIDDNEYFAVYREDDVAYVESAKYWKKKARRGQ